MMMKIFPLAFLTLPAHSCPTFGDSYWAQLGDSCYSVSHQAMDWGTAQQVEISNKCLKELSLAV